MNKLFASSLILLGGTLFWLGVDKASNGKREEERILAETPKVERVLKLEEELHSYEIRNKTFREVLEAISSNPQLEDKYRKIVREYIELRADEKISSAVDSYKSNRDYAGYYGMIFGAGAISMGCGFVGLFKR